MEFKLFSDIIDSIEKVIKGISALKELPQQERNHYREIINDTCVILDSAILLVVNRLGDILMNNDIGKFSEELQTLDNFQDWLKLERDVRLCNNLRVAGREMNSLWSKSSDRLDFQDIKEFKRFMQDIEHGERELANYISLSLARLAENGRLVNRAPLTIDNAKRTVRGVKNALLNERKHLITVQIKLLDEII